MEKSRDKSLTNFLKKAMKNFDASNSEENRPTNKGLSKSDIISMQYIRNHGTSFPVVFPDGRRQLMYIPPVYFH